MENTMLKFYTFLIISLLITSCATEPPDPVKVEAESKKPNDYFDRMFDEYVDRSPMLQTCLGIKKTMTNGATYRLSAMTSN